MIEAAKHDRQKRDQVLRAFARQVHSEVWRRARPNSELINVSFDDLFQEGMLGLCDAISHYEDKGGRFGDYAKYWIRQRIFLSHQRKHLVRVPQHHSAAMRSMAREIEELDQKLGRSASMDDLLEPADSKESILQALSSEDYQMRTIGLDEAAARGMESVWVSEVRSRAIVPMSCYQSAVFQEEEGGSGRPGYFEPRYTNRTPEDEYSESEFSRVLESVVDEVLSPRERGILSQYFGLGNRERKTLGEIARGVDLSSERVRQIRESALKKLRKTSLRREFRCHLQFLVSQTDDLS